MHAYLIIAHGDIPVLERLVSCLDDPRNDIYVHWDKKSGDIPLISTVNARLFFTERHDVRWGAFSMVEAEYELLETAVRNGLYEYYHLVSGVDLPIKNQDFIHAFCHANQGKEFIGFADASDKEIDYRTRHYFIFDDDFKGVSFFKHVARNLFVKLQDVLHYRRSRPFTVKKGSQWCSMTESFVRYLIDNKEEVRKSFRRTFCPDELFIQTLCFNSVFFKSVYNTADEFEGNLRYIKWKNGGLLDLSEDDFEPMVSSNRLFARKFPGDNAKLMDKVSKFVNSENEI